MTVNTGPTVRSASLLLAAKVFNFFSNPTFCQFSCMNRADCAEHFCDIRGNLKELMRKSTE